MIKVAPSILAFDQLHMGDDIQKMIDAGCDMLHFDIMDGHFVPNFGFGPALLKRIHGQYSMTLDVHLMVDNPSKYICQMAENGAGYITVHSEIAEDTRELVDMIHSCGAKAGVALKPATGVDDVKDVLDCADMVLVMTVEPGFGGQKFREEMVEKVRQLRKTGYSGLIQVDGGVSMSNMPILAEAGVDVAVMGTALYKAEDRKAMIDAIHSLR